LQILEDTGKILVLPVLCTSIVVPVSRPAASYYPNILTGVVRKNISERNKKNITTPPLQVRWSIPNDLPTAVSSKVRLFSDDCLLYREINNENDQNTLQIDLQHLEKWATNWGMRFNAKQCYMLSLRKKIQGSFKLDGHTLEQVPSSPYLGVQIQEDLKWKEHINNVTKKASSTLGFLRRNLQHCPRECRKNSLHGTDLVNNGIRSYHLGPV
jgi:hypothetical protein